MCNRSSEWSDCTIPKKVKAEDSDMLSSAINILPTQCDATLDDGLDVPDPAVTTDFLPEVKNA